MRRTTASLAVVAALVLTALSMPLGAVAATTASSGEADATSTLMRLTTGDGTATLAADDAVARTGASPRAFAELVTGTTGTTRVGVASRDRNTKGSGTQTLAQQGFAIGTLLDMGLVGASVATSIEDGLATSSVDVQIGDVDLMGGFARISGGSSMSDARVTNALAQTTRTVTVGGLETFALGDLLRALGASPLDLACAAVQDLGEATGVATAGACDQLDDVDGLIVSALAAVATQRAALVTLKDSTVTQIATTTTTLNDALAQQTTLNAQKATLEAQTAGLNRSTIQAARDAQAAACVGLIGPLLTTCNAAVAALDAQLAPFVQLDSVNAQLATVATTISTATATIAALNATLNDLIAAIAAVDAAAAVDATCAGVGDTLGTVTDVLPASSTTLDPIATNLAAACATLSATLRALIDAPLISMDGVDIAIDATARANTPTVEVTGTVGELKIGLLEPVAVDLSIGGDTVAQVQSLVSDTLDEIMSLLALDVPLPTFEFLVTDTDKGKRSDGTWFAQGSVTALRISMPAATLTLPDLAPLNVLDNATDLVPRTPLAAGRSDGARYRSLYAVSATSPAITFDIGTFDATSLFSPSTGGGGGGGSGTVGGGRLPKTGVEDHALLGLFLLAAAFAMRRLTLRAR